MQHPGSTLDAAFPDDADPPSALAQFNDRLFIQPLVAIDFRAPKSLAGFRPFEQMAIVAVPETAVHEDHRAMFWKHQIGLARQTPVVQQIAKALCMQAAPDK